MAVLPCIASADDSSNSRRSWELERNCEHVYKGAPSNTHARFFRATRFRQRYTCGPEINTYLEITPFLVFVFHAFACYKYLNLGLPRGRCQDGDEKEKPHPE
jgi:hypothetical protein